MPQLMPAGVLVTVPEPVPAFVTFTVNCVDVAGVKVAVTLRASVMLTTQDEVPVQAPPHPAKVEPAAGVAVSVIEVPEVKPAEHEFPQLIPAGELVTVPEPLPEVLTDKVKVAALLLGVTANL